MTDNLYFGRAWKYIKDECVVGDEDTGCKIIVASGQEEASRKFSRYLESSIFRNYIKNEVKVLTAGQDVPLEKRIEILKEVFEVIE